MRRIRESRADRLVRYLVEAEIMTYGRWLIRSVFWSTERHALDYYEEKAL